MVQAMKALQATPLVWLVSRERERERERERRGEEVIDRFRVSVNDVRKRKMSEKMIQN